MYIFYLLDFFLFSVLEKREKIWHWDKAGFLCVCTCLLFVVDCFIKKSVVAIISLKRKIDLATKVKKKWWES